MILLLYCVEISLYVVDRDGKKDFPRYVRGGIGTFRSVAPAPHANIGLGRRNNTGYNWEVFIDDVLSLLASFLYCLLYE